MKKILLLIILSSLVVLAQNGPEDKARGIFIAIGVGPRIPVAFFGSSTDMGYGINVEISYTDDQYLPIFLFAKAGFETYPGSQDFYRQSLYNNYTTNSVPLSAGARYYFKPLVQSIVLLIPLVEASVNFDYFYKLHQFKPTAQRLNYIEETTKLGFSVGGGFSMFMLEILATYNYYQTNQYYGLDLKVRLPLYITL
jgi:hypothetical protein